MELTKTAYTKITLHSLKHMSRDWVGLLIKNDNQIVDAIPLFHESVVGPSLDAAFHLIQDFYLTPNPSYKIAGIYEAGITSKTSKFLASTYRMLEVIKEGSVDKFIALKIITNEDDEDETAQINLVFDFYNYLGDNGIESTNSVTSKFTISDVKGFLTWNDYLKIADFDDHFENPVYDWRNDFFS